ncbi:MAG: DUF3810 domain-containing protein [Oscillospiraceae bacterium]
MNEVNTQSDSTKYIKNRCFWFIVLIPIGIGLLILSRLFPNLTEIVYSTKIYPIFMNLIVILTNWIPFSVAEVLLLFLPLTFLVWIVNVVKYTEKDKRKDKIKKIFSYIVAVASSFFFAFVLLEGINYNRNSFADYYEVVVEPSKKEDLSKLCKELISTANSLRYRMDEDEMGATKLTYQDIYETADEVSIAYEKLAEKYPVLSGPTIKAKPIIASKLMSYTQITGIFCPFTMEANINADVPDYSIPSTMCHEMTHIRGFMKEDEANFIAYLACKKSYDPQIQYSGVMLALVHSMNELYSADYDMFLDNYYKYSDEVKRDFQVYSQYWKKYEGPVAEISNKVNDTYLKMNNQNDGVKSYGRMVDLLIADYKKRNSK